MYYLKGKRVFLGLLTHPLPFFISPYLHWLGCSIFKQRVLDYCYTNQSLEVHDDNKNCYNFTDGSVLHLLFCKAD